MRWIITPILFAAILWIMAALSCQKRIDSVEMMGVIWNNANASGSIENVIWDRNNPCYTGPCTTFTRVPNYRTSGTPNPHPRDYPYNPFPFCYSCHGSGNWIYSNMSSTVMTYYSSHYKVQHSK